MTTDAHPDPSAGIASAPAGSRTAVIDFTPTSLIVTLLLAGPDGSFGVLDSRSLPPASAADLTETGLPAVLAAAVDVLRAGGITSPNDLHALYLSGAPAHDPLIQQTFRPLCADQRLKNPPRSIPISITSASGGQPSSRLRLSLVAGGVLAVVVVIVLAVVLMSGGHDGSDQGRYPAVKVGMSYYNNYGAVDATMRRLYVGNRTDKSVSVVDTANRKVVATIPLPDEPMGIAVDAEMHRVYVVSAGDEKQGDNRRGKLTVIDSVTNTVQKSIETGKSSWGIAVDSGTHVVYVVNTNALGYSLENWRTNSNGSSNVSVIDPQSLTVTTAIDVGANAIGIAIDSTTETAYVTGAYNDPAQHNDDSDGVVMLDLKANRVSGYRHTPSFPHGVFGVSVDSGTHTALVTSHDKVFVMDTVTTAILATLPAGGTGSITLDEARHTAYVVSSGGPNEPYKIAVIDTEKRSVTTNIDTGSGVLLGLAVDPASHYVYGLTGESVLFIPSAR